MEQMRQGAWQLIGFMSLVMMVIKKNMSRANRLVRFYSK
jgi:hypothetical protein